MLSGYMADKENEMTSTRWNVVESPLVVSQTEDPFGVRLQSAGLQKLSIPVQNRPFYRPVEGKLPQIRLKSEVWLEQKGAH